MSKNIVPYATVSYLFRKEIEAKTLICPTVALSRNKVWAYKFAATPYYVTAGMGKVVMSRTQHMSRTQRNSLEFIIDA